MNTASKIVISIAAVALISACTAPNSVPSAAPASSTAISTRQPLLNADKAVDQHFGQPYQTSREHNPLKITVTRAEPFTPSNGVAAGLTPVKFSITVENLGIENWDPRTVIIDVTSVGQLADAFTDPQDPQTAEPTALLKPGQTLTWTPAFTIADPADTTLVFSPGPDYPAARYS